MGNEKQDEFLRYFYIYIVEFYDEDDDFVCSEEFDDEEEATTFIDLNAHFHYRATLTKERYKGIFEDAEDISLEED